MLQVRSRPLLLDSIILNTLNVPIRPIESKRIILTKWSRPNKDHFKLNTDGASRGNPGISAGGGIVRNHEGKLIRAFGKFYGICSNIMAEIRAIHDGLDLCHLLELHNIIVESDCKVIVDFFNGKANLPWPIWYWKNKIMEKVSTLSCSFHHTFRENNRVADGLANLSCDSLADCYVESEITLPLNIKGLVLIEKTGLPNIRRYSMPYFARFPVI
nr:TPA_asm: hypothetical protein HUJ06_027073 [Nelumbo nucifera]DAD25624.1 TPA_asm: hypothetical protein HUJ06_027088 [Nelumbo nucifera]